MFTIAATLTSLRLTADKCLSIGFHTQELSPADKLEAIKYHQQTGWLLFRENEFNDADAPDVDAPDDSKTPGQRLRGVLYRVFETTGRQKGEWGAWYCTEMERIITHYKGKLD